MNLVSILYKYARRTLLIGSGILIGASNYEFFDDIRFNLGKKIHEKVEEKLLFSPDDENYKTLEELCVLREYKK